jgi:hypothetical protein
MNGRDDGMGATTGWVRRDGRYAATVDDDVRKPLIGQMEAAQLALRQVMRCHVPVRVCCPSPIYHYRCLPKDAGHPSTSVKYGNLRIVRAI